MTPATIGILIFAGMIILVLLGIPICVSMLAGSILGFFILGGDTMMVMQFVQAPFKLSASYTYAVIPLFMLVGTLAGETGIAEGAFSCMKKWLGRLRGGLLYTVIGANAVFGACSGLSAAGNVVFSKIAIPELDRANYDKSLSMGCITASGCLSALIPPSVPIITFCLLTELSVGRALVYGLSGGIVFVLLMFATVFVIAKLFPGKIPPPAEADRNISFTEKLKTLKLLLPMLALFALIVGGCFLGWFPATVGGAIASVVLIIYALFKRVPLKTIGKCTWDAAQMFCGIYVIIISGTIFSRFVTITGIAQALINGISASNIPPYCIFLLVLLFYIICGCLMDIMSIIVISVPVVFPLLTGLGFDPYVLCIVLVFVCDMASLTPPIGIGVFTVANTLREEPSVVFKGVWPFFVTELAMVLLIGAVPSILTWLPRLLGS